MGSTILLGSALVACSSASPICPAGEVCTPAGGTGGSGTGVGGQVVGAGGQVVGAGGQVVGAGGQVVGAGGQVVGAGGQVVGAGGQVVGAGGQVVGAGGGSGATGGGDDGPLGGYHVKGDWSGFAFSFATGVSTITPENFEDMINVDGPYCVSGTSVGDEEYKNIAALGFHAKQQKVSDAEVQLIAPSGDGLFIDLQVNGGEEGIRVQIEDGTDPEAEDSSEHRWCANLSGTQATTIPWSTFNLECWESNPDPDFAFDPAVTKIDKVIVSVPNSGVTGDDFPFDFCVNDIGPDNVQGRGTGEIVASCGNSLNWSGTITDNFGQQDGGNYQFQANGWNMVNGNMAIQLLPGAGFKMNTQSCNTTTDSPCSFPSVYVGTDADGTRTSGFSPTPISNINALPTCLGWSSGGSAGQEYNVSYDVWFNSNPQGTYAEKFLMVWFHDPPSFQPGGMFPAQDGVVIGDQTWSVWFGPNHANQDVVSYVAPNGLADGQAYSFNLKDFMDDAVERGYLQPSLNLIAVMGGMEIWGGGQGASIDGFRAEVQ